MDAPDGRSSAMHLTKLLVSFLFLLSFVSAHRNRVVGGHECAPDQHPWLVLLSDSYGPYCAGVLLNQDWVITAAHCYSSEEIQLRLGVHSIEDPGEDEQTRVAISTICYNAPDCLSYSDDIMLLLLNSSVTYTARVAPLILPTVCPLEEILCCVMGWGSITTTKDTYPDVPYCAPVTILSDKVCQDAYPGLVNDRMICAGDLEGGIGSCKGDSGGPLICNGKLQGIVSFGSDPCAQQSHPGVYIKICMFLDWIQSTITGSGAS